MKRPCTYAQEGNHYETRCVLSIACRRTSAVQTRFGNALLADVAPDAERDREREWFQQQLQEFADAISPVWKLVPLDSVGAALAHHELYQRADVPGAGAAASGAARRGAG